MEEELARDMGGTLLACRMAHNRIRKSLNLPRDAAAYSFSASAPPMISISSLVIAAWRARL